MVKKIISGIKGVLNPINIIEDIIGGGFGKTYKGEKIADRFAAIYGFGPELSAALSKIEMGGKSGLVAQDVIQKCPVVGLIYNSITLPFNLVTRLTNEHPIVLERIEDNIKGLKKELNNPNCPNKLKPILKENIKDMEKTKRSIMKINPIYKENAFAQKVYNLAMYKLFGGDIKRFIIGQKDMDDKFDQLFNQ